MGYNRCGRVPTLRLKASLLLGVMLAASVALTGCGKDGPAAALDPASREKVATVNETVITKKEYDQAFQEIAGAYQVNQNPNMATNPVVQEVLKRAALNKLIMMSLLRAESEKLNIQVSEEDVEKYKEKLLKAAGGPEAFRQLLQKSNLEEAAFWDSVRDQILMEKFVEAKAGASVQITEADAKAYYEKHPKEFDVPETIHATHILVKAMEPELKKEIQSQKPNISDKDLILELKARKEQLKEKADGLLARVKKSPEQLPELARKYSDDSLSAINGGDLGFLPQRYTDPAFWQAASATKPGSVYPQLVESQFGFHIVKVLGHQPPHQQSFLEAKQTIQDALANEKKQVYLSQWLNEQQKTAKIEIEPKYKPTQGQAAGAPAAAMSGGEAAAGASAAGSPSGETAASATTKPAEASPKQAH
ncbi:MAG: SurA N-terminal domain-containing protein [Candidatus Melainabacteria bacterium]|nr:SurA N-terminal domain-containing protein [Candidatus Melainabacteria bacterium]